MKSVAIVLIPVFLFFGTGLQSDPWKAPKEAESVKNPVGKSEKSLATGRKIFKSYCVSCHGNSGKGDGPAGVNMRPKPADLSSAAFQEQSDGAIFWKLSEGRGMMAPYKHSLTTEQRWHLVNMMRTF